MSKQRKKITLTAGEEIQNETRKWKTIKTGGRYNIESESESESKILKQRRVRSKDVSYAL